MFEISWQRPKDYDINTGLADPYAGGNTKDRLPIQSTVYQATRVVSEFRQGKFEQTIEGSLFMFPKPDGTNTVGKSTAANPGTPEAGIAFNQGSLGTRPNAQSPTVAQNFVNTTNTSVVNSITNGAALSSTGTRPATAPPITNIVASTTPPATVNNNSIIGPSSYPRASTGSGVVPIQTTESAPQPLNVNPFVTAGRTQTIVRES